ncbi:MAG: hypothetical protein C4529_06780 [Deltaproteobacteria bacterium]|nr:MAG: hypothetical protein C4529_06780 [Deltaproteobacteria bacterium]
MDRWIPNGRGKFRLAKGTAGVLAALLLGLALLIAIPSAATATDNGTAGTFEDRAAAERMSRSRYRGLEVASLVVILLAGAGAVLWAVRRRKP